MKLNTYLTLNGNCEEAFLFYAEVLGGQIVAMMKHGDMPADSQMPGASPNMVVHARLIVGGTVLMGADGMAGNHYDASGYHVSLVVDSIEETERAYAALLEGGTATFPLQETFWAHRFGMIKDKYGIPWMFNCEKSMG